MLRRSVLLAVCLFALAAAYYFYPEKALPADARIERLVVVKKERKLYAYSAAGLLKVYPVSLGWSPQGHKAVEGDGKTPEGKYRIYDKNPRSVCYLNLGISYPSEKDKAHARELGRPPGGAIKLHGIDPKWAWVGKFHRWYDWSNGCICLTNPEIKELYEHTAIGTPIEILP